MRNRDGAAPERERPPLPAVAEAIQHLYAAVVRDAGDAWLQSDDAVALIHEAAARLVRRAGLLRSSRQLQEAVTETGRSLFCEAQQAYDALADWLERLERDQPAMAGAVVYAAVEPVWDAEGRRVSNRSALPMWRVVIGLAPGAEQGLGLPHSTTTHAIVYASNAEAFVMSALPRAGSEENHSAPG